MTSDWGCYQGHNYGRNKYEAQNHGTRKKSMRGIQNFSFLVNHFTCSCFQNEHSREVLKSISIKRSFSFHWLEKLAAQYFIASAEVDTVRAEGTRTPNRTDCCYLG